MLLNALLQLKSAQHVSGIHMPRAFTCPSSGARDYTCVISAYGV